AHDCVSRLALEEGRLAVTDAPRRAPSLHGGGNQTAADLSVKEAHSWCISFAGSALRSRWRAFSSRGRPPRRARRRQLATLTFTSTTTPRASIRWRGSRVTPTARSRRSRAHPSQPAGPARAH